MHVGRDVPEHLAAKVGSGLALVPGERFELVVRLDGRRPDADFLVVTNARVASVKSDDVPARMVRLQVLADEIQAWRLSRKWRSRLTVTSGYGRSTVFGSGLTAYDDDPVDAALTALVAGRADPVVAKALTALRARAHWISSPYGRSVHVLDRAAVPNDAAGYADLDLVEAQLRHCDYWPASEVRRHVAVCVPAGGCFLARDAGPSGDGTSHANRVAAALVTVDAIKLRKSSGGEAGVVDRLMTVVAHVRSSPAWTSDRSHDARVDVDREVTTVALAAHRTAELRVALGERPSGRSETARRAADVYDSAEASLDTVAERLVERVDVLESYRDRLHKLSRELGDLDDAERIDRLSEKVSALAATVPGDGSVTGGDGPQAGAVPLPRRTPDASREGVPSQRSPSPRADSAGAVQDAVTALRREADRLGTLVRTTVDGTARKANDD